MPPPLPPESEPPPAQVLFKTVRKDLVLFANHVPVMIHVNYHPDKFERMQVRGGRALPA